MNFFSFIKHFKIEALPCCHLFVCQILSALSQCYRLSTFRWSENNSKEAKKLGQICPWEKIGKMSPSFQSIAMCFLLKEKGEEFYHKAHSFLLLFPPYKKRK